MRDETKLPFDMTAFESTEQRRAKLISTGRLEPSRRDDLKLWQPLPPAADGEPTLTEILLAMRDRERT